MHPNRLQIRFFIAEAKPNPTAAKISSVGDECGLAEGAATAMRLTKRAAYQGLHMDFTTHLDQISSHFVLAAKSPEHREGVNAFLEKRKPNFKG